MKLLSKGLDTFGSAKQLRSQAEEGLAQVDAPFTGPQRWMILTSRSGTCATSSTLRPEEPKVSSR